MWSSHRKMGTKGCSSAGQGTASTCPHSIPAPKSTFAASGYIPRDDADQFRKIEEAASLRSDCVIGVLRNAGRLPGGITVPFQQKPHVSANQCQSPAQ